MRIHTYSCLAAVSGSLAACNAQPVVNPGVAGAGVTTEIVGVDHDSTGYTVHFRMTNHDTGGVGYGACEGVVEVPTESGWTSVTHWGQCELWLAILPPTGTATFAIPQQTLVQGSQIRVALDWAFAFSNGGAATLSTTDPVVVP
jgi:hypothetical protein